MGLDFKPRFTKPKVPNIVTRTAAAAGYIAAGTTMGAVAGGTVGAAVGAGFAGGAFGLAEIFKDFFTLDRM